MYQVVVKHGDSGELVHLSDFRTSDDAQRYIGGSPDGLHPGKCEELTPDTVLLLLDDAGAVIATVPGRNTSTPDS